MFNTNSIFNKNSTCYATSDSEVSLSRIQYKVTDIFKYTPSALLTSAVVDPGVGAGAHAPPPPFQNKIEHPFITNIAKHVFSPVFIHHIIIQNMDFGILKEKSYKDTPYRPPPPPGQSRSLFRQILDPTLQ